MTSYRIKHLQRQQQLKVAAEARAANAASDKSYEETQRLRFQNVRSLVVTVSTLYGLLAVFAYTYSEGVGFVGGLSAGDSLFFAFVAMALGAIGVLLATAGCVAMLPFFSASGLAGKRISLGPRWLRTTRLAVVLLPELFFIAPYLGLDTVSFLNGSSPLGQFFILAGLCILSTWATASLIKPTKLVDGRLEAWLLGLVASAMHLLVAVFSHQQPVWYLLGGCMLAGFFVLVTMATIDSPVSPPGQRSTQNGRGSAIAIALGLSVVLPVLGMMLEPTGQLRRQIKTVVFGGLGVRSEGVMVRLSPATADAVRSASQLQGFSPSLCRLPGSGYLMSDVLVLWHGIGNRTYLLWPAGAAGKPPNAQALRTDVPSSDVGIVRGALLRCVEVPDSAFFESGRAGRIAPVAAAQIVSALVIHCQAAMASGQALIGIEVLGHTDPMPVTGGNNRLGLERAQQVMAILQESPQLAPFLTAGGIKPTAASSGARDPVKECAGSGSAEIQRECNAVNRRVEIRLRFGPAKTFTSQAKGA